jgi:predicted glycosyltransferase involved in capsule biosynthesis
MEYFKTGIIFFIAYGMAFIIARRCFSVLHGMNRKTWAGPYWKFFGFGVSYAILMIAAIGGAVNICAGVSEAGYWLFMAGSSGLILFDRRSRKKLGGIDESDPAATP